jgi:cytochrome c oxidase assembly factor CtaG
MKGVTVSVVLSRLRPWLTVAGAVATLVMLLPPVGTYAREYAFAQALQFAIFAVAAPALLVIGAPARISAASAWPGSIARRVLGRPGHRGQPSETTVIRLAALRLAAFMALVIVWRLPGTTRALAANPALALLEMVTLEAAGIALWVELAGPASDDGSRTSRPLRVAIAALSMWTIWIIAYITGMSSTRASGSRLGTVTDQQIGVAIMWAVPAVCFVPLIYALMISWLGERDDPDRELREADGHGSPLTGLAGAPRPPRGWRLPRG